MHKIDMWIDGACVPNPGQGAWAVLLTFEGHEKMISGVIEGETTNQRAEITAAIQGFNAIKEGWLCDVTVNTDSKYLVKIMDGEWNINANADLFDQLEFAIGLHKVRWQWVKGHSGIPENERCDELAESEARRAFEAMQS